MSVKVKLISFISAFVLVLGIMIIGVLYPLTQPMFMQRYDIYLALTSQSACEDLIYYVNDTGDTVKVLKSVVDSVDPDFTVNTYLNGSNFTRSVSEDGLYYVYTHI